MRPVLLNDCCVAAAVLAGAVAGGLAVRWLPLRIDPPCSWRPGTGARLPPPAVAPSVASRWRRQPTVSSVRVRPSRVRCAQSGLMRRTVLVQIRNRHTASRMARSWRFQPNRSSAACLTSS